MEERLREFQELEDLRLAKLTGVTPSEGTSCDPNPMMLEVPQITTVCAPRCSLRGLKVGHVRPLCRLQWQRHKESYASSGGLVLGRTWG